MPRDTLLAKVAPRGVVAGVREHRQFFPSVSPASDLRYVDANAF